MFSVSITSNRAGSRTSCIAMLSTYRCSKRTSAYSDAWSAVTVSRHSLEVSRTLALSTLATRPRRRRAASKATRATRSISCAA